MTLSSIKPYSKAIIITGIVIVLLIVTIAALLPKRTNPNQNLETTPTQTVPPINNNVQLNQPPNFQSDVEKIQSVLPYKNDQFEIIYQKYPNIVNINITASTPEEYLQNKTAAENYIKSQGVEDLCSLNIFWNPPVELLKKINAKDIITTGCSPSPKR